MRAAETAHISVVARDGRRLPAHIPALTSSNVKPNILGVNVRPAMLCATCE
jgi:hypothetical protein